MTMDNEINVNDNMPDDANKAMPTSNGIGERLKTAREAMGLSEKEAASRMHLSVRFINIMENEDFKHGLPPTFMRGYLHAYGRILNIPRPDIELAIEQLGMNTVSAPVKPPLLHDSTNAYTIDRYARWVTYFIIPALIILMGIWWSARPTETSLTDLSKAGSPKPQVPENPAAAVATEATTAANAAASPAMSAQPTNPLAHPSADSDLNQPPVPAAPVVAEPAPVTNSETVSPDSSTTSLARQPQPETEMNSNPHNTNLDTFPADPAPTQSSENLNGASTPPASPLVTNSEPSNAEASVKKATPKKRKYRQRRHHNHYYHHQQRYDQQRYDMYEPGLF